jgi:hypothetical protein
MSPEGHHSSVALIAGGDGLLAATVVAEPMGSAQQLAEEEGLSFAPTPGPGDSEGGDVYAPEGTGQDRANNACPSSR